MTAKGSAQHTLGEAAAFQLANVTKTAPQYGAITPRWLVRLLDWKPVEAGTLRLNRVVDDKSVEVVCEPKQESCHSGGLRGLRGEASRVHAELDLERPAGRHQGVRPVQQPLRSGRRAAQADDRDGQGAPGGRTHQQQRLRAAAQRPRLPAHQDAQGRAYTRRPRRTPEQGLEGTLVLPRASPGHRRLWPRVHASRRPATDHHPLRHPDADVARRAPGSHQQAPGGWPDQSHGGGGSTSILLLRVGEKKQGVIGLYQPGLPGEQTPGLSVRFMGLDQRSIASYLVALYCSAAVLVDDAIASLDGVEVGTYHDYK